jgi:hypothetical protein
MEHVRYRSSVPILAIIEPDFDTEQEQPLGWMLMERLPGDAVDATWPNMPE